MMKDSTNNKGDGKYGTGWSRSKRKVPAGWMIRSGVGAHGKHLPSTLMPLPSYINMIWGFKRFKIWITLSLRIKTPEVEIESSRIGIGSSESILKSELSNYNSNLNGFDLGLCNSHTKIKSPKLETLISTQEYVIPT